MNKIYDGLVAVVERKIEARDYGQTVEDLFVTPDKLFDAASDEIKRLQAELKALRDWRTPPYSESQQAQAPPKPARVFADLDAIRAAHPGSTLHAYTPTETGGRN